MTRMIRGSVLLAACVGLLSCSSDPLGNDAGVPYKIVSAPSTVFVTQGSSQLIGFQLVDELDGQIPTTWTIGATPAIFTVALDSSYRPIYNPDGTLTLPGEQTEVRATITGIASGAGEFTVSGGGKSITIPVKVVPSILPATFSNTTPDIGEQITMTMPAGLVLNFNATYAFGNAAPPIVVSQAVDGSSVTLLVAPGTDAPLTVTGVSPDFAPNVVLTLVTSDTVTATSTSDFVGTDDPSTAPTITLGAVGSSVSFYDIPSAIDMFYRIDLAVATTIKVTTDWADHGADVDQLYLNAAFGLIAPFTAATGAAPEVSTAVYAAGTYYIYINQYSGNPGDWQQITIETVSEP